MKITTINTTPNQHIINELIWDGYNFDEVAKIFNMDEEDVIKILQRDPVTLKQIEAEYIFCQNETRESPQDYGFSKREILQSIEHISNKEDQMEKSGFWLDVFCWDEKNSRYLRARKERNREKPPLSPIALEDLIDTYKYIFSQKTRIYKWKVNSKGLSKEDYLQEVTIDNIKRGYFGGEKAMLFQANRDFYQKH